MKIGNNPNSIQNGLTQGLGGKDRVTKSSDGAGPEGKKISADVLQDSARVNISEKAKEMQRVKELAKQAPDVDAEKVAKFRSLIASGEYKVNAEAIADRMLDDELSLAATQG